MSTPSGRTESAPPASDALPRRSRRDQLAALGAGLVAGAAWWCSTGELAVESAVPGAARLGVLPGWTSGLAALAVFGASTYALQRASPLRRIRGWFYPIYGTSLAFLPWLPLPLPASALFWAGPAVWWVWAGVGMAIAGVIGSSPAVTRPAAIVRWFARPRAAWSAALLAALLYGVAAVYLAPVYPGGDEPHYLIITQSLVNDGDLRIENNHRQQDYIPYFPASLGPHYLQRGLDGEIYSVHAPGLPALLAPAFLIGGYPAVVAFLIAIAALLSALVWKAAASASGQSGAAWFASAGVLTSSPVLFHAFAVYPEIAGAAVILAAVATLTTLDRAPIPWTTSATPSTGDLGAGPARWPWSRWLLLGAGLALLPWLHTRYAVAAVALGLLLAGRLVGRQGALGRLAALFAVPIASAAGWLGFFKVVYGTFSPTAPYGHYTQTHLAHVPVGLQGLLIDQQFGLLPAAPVFLVAFAGFATLFRSRRRLAAELFALVAIYAVAVAAYRMWWGGWSAPGRFLVPVLPVLAVPMAAWWAAHRGAARLTAAALLGLGLLTSTSSLLVGRGGLIFNPRDSVSRLLEWVSPLVAADRALPSLFRHDVVPPLALAASWLVGLVVGLGLLTWAHRRWRASEPGVGAVLTVFVTALLLMSGLEFGWRMQRAPRPLDGSASRVSLLEAAARHANGIGISYRPLGIVPPTQLVTRIRLSPSTRRPPRTQGPAFSLAPVPAGEYRLDAGSLASATTTLSVTIGRGERPVAVWPVDPTTRTTERTLRMPCAVNAVAIDADAAAHDAVARLALQPMRVWSAEGCPDLRAHRGLRYGSATVYFFDASAYPEAGGFWIRGRAESTVAVVPDGLATVVRLDVQGGAVALRVRLESGAWVDEFGLDAGEHRQIAVPTSRTTRAALIRFRPDGGFVPSTIDPASRDRRFLGCWVTVPD